MTNLPESKSSATPPDSHTEGYLALTEETAKSAIIEARGDIFVASQLLRITAIRLDRAIAISPILQAVLDECRKKDSRPLTDDVLREAVERRVALYRVAGLDALHELATMPLDANSAQNQVKLAAAARLAGTTEGSSGAGDLAETLRELNDLYQKEAPRLRVVRERVTIETVPEEKTVSQETSE